MDNKENNENNQKEKENESNKNIIDNTNKSFKSIIEAIKINLENMERQNKKMRKINEEMVRKNEEMIRQNEEMLRNNEEMRRNNENILRTLNQLGYEVRRIRKDLGINQDNYSHLVETKIEIDKLNEENKRCIICYEDFKDNDNGIFLPCFHVFHSNCIKTWLKNKDNCPLCKFNVNGNL